MRGVAIAGFALMLAGFGPPERPGDSPGLAQQSPPRSWIPEPVQKPPPAELHVFPWEQNAKPALPDTCANGYTAPPRSPDFALPPGLQGNQVITPEEMFERACRTLPPEQPDRQFVDCP